MKNQTNSIIWIILGLHWIGIVCGCIELWPEQFSIVVHEALVVLHPFAALLLSVVQDFAVDAEFDIPGSIGTTLRFVARVVPVKVVLA